MASERKQLNVSVDADLIRAAKQYCLDNNIKLTDYISALLRRELQP